MTELAILTELLNKVNKLEAEVAALKAAKTSTSTTTVTSPSDTWKVKITDNKEFSEIFETGLSKSDVTIFDISVEILPYSGIAYLKYHNRRAQLGNIPKGGKYAVICI